MDSPDLASELKAMREGSAVFLTDLFGQCVISGPDAAAFLHRMLSNEVQKLQPGEGRYQGLLDRKGMTLSLFYLFRLGPQDFLAIMPPQLAEKTVSLLTKMKFIEKLSIADESRKRSLLLLIGPKAVEEALPLVPSDLPHWRDDALGVPIVCVSGPTETLAVLEQQCPPEMIRVSKTALDIQRMSAGFPDYGVDIDERHILLESPVPVAHQRNKGCYPGQEVIERISTYGKGRTPKRLIRLFFKGRSPVQSGTEIFNQSGEKAGHVTSSCYDPLDEGTIALAYVDNKFSDDSTLSPQEPASPPISS